MIVETDDGRRLKAHCPNPGRLSEILTPGSRLILEERGASPGAATRFALVGAYYRGGVVPMYASRANGLARDLLLPRLFPHATMIEQEVRIGTSRIDFRLHQRRLTHLIEVKAVTLVEKGVAMFPDAPSIRATRHLDELATLPTDQSHVLFVVMQPQARVLVPNLHTDPDFAAAVYRYRKSIHYHAAVLRTDRDGFAWIVRTRIPVELRPLRLVHEDSGCYLLQLRLSGPRRITVGRLGTIDFPAGYYLYVGSARRGLSKRIARHLRVRGKTPRWHIDYLRAETEKPKTVRLYGSKSDAAIAAELAPTAEWLVPGFGASDSPVPSHLFHYASPPLSNRAVIAVILDHQHADCIASGDSAEYHTQ